MAGQAFATTSRNQSQKCLTQIGTLYYNLTTVRTPTPESLDFTYFDLWGAFSPYPKGYPSVPLMSFDADSVEELLMQREFERMESAKYWSKQLDIAGYIQACTMTKLSFSDWIGTLGADPFVLRYGLPTPIKEALKAESKRIVEEQNKQREEELAKLKLDNQTVNRHSSINIGGPSSIDRYLK